MKKIHSSGRCGAFRYKAKLSTCFSCKQLGGAIKRGGRSLALAVLAIRVWPERVGVRRWRETAQSCQVERRKGQDASFAPPHEPARSGVAPRRAASRQSARKAATGQLVGEKWRLRTRARRINLAETSPRRQSIAQRQHSPVAMPTGSVIPAGRAKRIPFAQGFACGAQLCPRAIFCSFLPRYVSTLRQRRRGAFKRENSRSSDRRRRASPRRAHPSADGSISRSLPPVIASFAPQRRSGAV